MKTKNKRFEKYGEMCDWVRFSFDSLSSFDVIDQIKASENKVSYYTYFSSRGAVGRRGAKLLTERGWDRAAEGCVAARVGGSWG